MEEKLDKFCTIFGILFSLPIAMFLFIKSIIVFHFNEIVNAIQN